MADIPFSWCIDLELSRIRTLYGNGENPVLPYEPPSTVIKISKFHLGTVSGTQWLLQFEHTKIYDQSFYGQQEKVALLLERDYGNGNVEIKGTVSLYDISSRIKLCESFFDNIIGNGDCTLPISLDLTMCELSHIVFENSKLCVQGNVSISFQEQISSIVENNYEGTTIASEIHIINSNPLTQLSYDLSSLLEEGSFSDVTIKCDSSEIRAHKNIMPARSPVFGAMFKSDMMEGEGNELVMTDLKLPVLRKMLIFIYSSQVKDLDVEMACDLLFAGDKYEILGLVDICVTYLKSNLTSENALQMLTVADLHDNDLKVYVMNYISCYFSYFENTLEWKALKENNQSLYIDVLEHTLNVRFREKANAKCEIEDNSVES